MEHNYLLIGLGGTGGRILRELRIRFHEERNALPGNIGFLYVDSGEELMRPEDPLWLTRNGYHVCFYPSEFLNIGTIHPYTIIEHPEAFPHLKELAEGWSYETEGRKLGAYLTLLANRHGLLWRDDRTEEDGEAQKDWEASVSENLYFMDFISDEDAELINSNRVAA